MHDGFYGMPIITALKAKKQNKERVRLYLDDGFAFELPAMQAAKLHCGQCLTEAEVKALIHEDKIQSAFHRAVHFLSFRPRSAEEVRRHLVKKGSSDSVIASVIEGLRHHGYVDDIAFARFWIENRNAFKPMAPRALRYELRQKGVDDDVFQTLVAELDVEDAACRAASKQLWRYRGKTRQEFMHKLGGMLQRRGFDHDIIRTVIPRLQAELDESDPDYFACADEE